jgi:hypothetical protein
MILEMKSFDHPSLKLLMGSRTFSMLGNWCRGVPKMLLIINLFSRAVIVMNENANLY